MKTLKNLFVIAMVLTFSFSFTSCTDDDEKIEIIEEINKEREKNSTTEENLVDPKDVKPPTNG
ncbi:hypothetical protein ABMY20_12855 [Tenacibaculum sp. SSH1-16]|uniref:hypothetical protein n=1 Tax=Tenacibaculum sp. SSH1-16 TaxID=3136667 RepID=UPI0032C4873F